MASADAALARQAHDDAAVNCAIRELRLTRFRNFTEARLDADARHIVLTGPNGSGKTNIMEAVSLLTPGRGIRRAKLADMVRAGSTDGFSVFAGLEHGQDRYSIGTGTAGQALTSDATPVRKLRIDGTVARSVDELMPLCRIMWLTPAMDGLFTGPASDRRRFVDRMVLAIDPAHGQRASDYERAMRQRNRLLEQPPGRQTDAWLDGIEEQLAAIGTAIISARQELCALIAQPPPEQSDGSNDFPTSLFQLEGELEQMARTAVPASQIETVLLDRLSALRHRDRAAGRTLSGPHRAE